MTSDRERNERALLGVLEVMRPYLDDVVLIGGWVPYLHQTYGELRSAWSGRCSLTTEADVLLPDTLNAGERAPLPTLLADAGFSPIPGTGTAAVWARPPATGEKVEFLVSHTGTYAQLRTVVPVSGHRPLGAISLAGLALMRQHSTVLQLPAHSTASLSVRVPTLGAYVINKATTFTHRLELAETGTEEKRWKDLLYLVDPG